MSRCEAFNTIVSGCVQGVNFRVSMQEKALELDVQGWVCNTTSGEVMAHCEGDAQALAAMRLWLEDGPNHANVEDLIVMPAEVEGMVQFVIAHDQERSTFRWASSA